MSEQRPAAVTFMGKPLTAVGPKLAVGDPAPDFKLLDGSMTELSLSDTGTRVRLFSVVPSLDTPVCADQTRRFETELAGLPETVGLYAISVDLPFAQTRFCREAKISRTVALSDHRTLSFGEGYGVAIEELRMLSRAIFVLDAENRIQYCEYVTEISDHPNYETAIAAVKKLAT